MITLSVCFCLFIFFICFFCAHAFIHNNCQPTYCSLSEIYYFTVYFLFIYFCSFFNIFILIFMICSLSEIYLLIMYLLLLLLFAHLFFVDYYLLIIFSPPEMSFCCPKRPPRSRSSISASTCTSHGPLRYVACCFDNMSMVYVYVCCVYFHVLHVYVHVKEKRYMCG